MAFPPGVSTESIESELGESAEALALLNKAYMDHDSSLLSLKVDPVFDPLRNEPDFRALMAKLRFPPEGNARGDQR